MNLNVPLSAIIIVSIVLFFLLIHTWLKIKKNSRMAEATSILRDEADDVHHVNIFPEGPSLDSYSEPFLNTASSIQNLPEQDEIDFNLIGKKASPIFEEDLIVINVVAKNGTHFVSYDLLQAISATGMQFGAMNIFHYYLQTPAGNKTLFNLVSATEPGDFDLNNIGELSCAGLTLFMNCRDVSNALDTFEIMLETAEQLADDLDGDLFAGPTQPWNETIKQQYENKAREYAYLS